MISNDTNPHGPQRRKQRSLPRARYFFDTLLTTKRRRLRTVLALALACAGASLFLAG